MERTWLLAFQYTNIEIAGIIQELPVNSSPPVRFAFPFSQSTCPDIDITLYLFIYHLSHNLLLGLRALLTKVLILLTASIPIRAIQLLLRDLRLNQRTSIILPATGIPPDQRRDQDRRHEHDGPVHILTRNRADGWQEEDDTDEESPGAGPDVDDIPKFAHVPGARLELAEDDLAEDGDTVRPVERDGGDIEYTRDSGVGTEANQVDGDAPEDAEPNGE